MVLPRKELDLYAKRSFCKEITTILGFIRIVEFGSRHLADFIPAP